MSKIKLNLCWNFGELKKLLQTVTVKNCFWVCFFSEFSLFWCNKVIFVLMFGTQYYFCSMFCAENWIVVRVKLTMRFYGDVTLPLTVQSRCYCGNVHGVFVHISVRFLYVQNRKSFCHCRTQLRRCKSFKPCWFLAYVEKNVYFLQASQRHDQDSWCRIFFVTTTLQQNC